MTGRTGYTAPTNASAPDGPTQITAVYSHFDSKVGETVATVADLPSSGNWAGRTIWVAAAGGGVRRWNGSAWIPYASEWTDYTPTLTNLVVGTGGTVQAEWQYQSPKVVRVRLCLTMGGSGLSMPATPKFTLPVPAAATWTPYQVLAGSVMAFDASAGGVYDVNLAVAMDNTSTTTAYCHYINGTAPFTWAVGDKYYAEFAYRV